MLNITVTSAKHSYNITHIAAYNLPDRNNSETFTPIKKEIIRGTMSNSTVESLMGGGAYHVRFVSPLQNNTIEGPPRSSGNSTIVVPDSYFVQINLVNGTAYVSAHVDQNFPTVANTYADEPFSTECFVSPIGS